MSLLSNSDDDDEDKMDSEVIFMDIIFKSIQKWLLHQSNLSNKPKNNQIFEFNVIGLERINS